MRPSATLLDADVLSELVKPVPDPRVSAFVAAQTDPFTSVVTIPELTWGAERAPDPARRARLIAWIAALRAQFAGRLVDLDADLAEHSGRLRAAAAAQGHPVEAVDALIAACALARGAVVATRNVKDFLPLGVSALDPWAA